MMRPLDLRSRARWMPPPLCQTSPQTVPPSGAVGGGKFTALGDMSRVSGMSGGAAPGSRSERRLTGGARRGVGETGGSAGGRAASGAGGSTRAVGRWTFAPGSGSEQPLTGGTRRGGGRQVEALAGEPSVAPAGARARWGAGLSHRGSRSEWRLTGGTRRHELVLERGGMVGTFAPIRGLGGGHDAHPGLTPPARRGLRSPGAGDSAPLRGRSEVGGSRRWVAWAGCLGCREAPHRAAAQSGG